MQENLYKVTIPITAASMDRALELMDRAAALQPDFLELRLDYMPNPKVEKLVQHTDVPKIVTIRHKAEGGQDRIDNEQRRDYLLEAIAAGAAMVDTEYRHPIDLTGQLRDTRLILSYHDFDETPGDLSAIHGDIVAEGADIVKIAVKANSPNDALKMMNLLSEIRETTIGISMGPYGVITRVAGPALSSYLTFATIDGHEELEPGQLSISQLREEWKTLGFDQREGPPQEKPFSMRDLDDVDEGHV